DKVIIVNKEKNKKVELLCLNF
ncbi:hypothetical protein A5868_001579, partial [Enterococcus sp. 12F9_DIV0723]